MIRSKIEEIIGKIEEENPGSVPNELKRNAHDIEREIDRMAGKGMDFDSVADRALLLIERRSSRSFLHRHKEIEKEIKENLNDLKK